MTSPLPDFREDPAVIRALGLKAAHADLTTAIRDDPDRSESARARDLEATDATVNADLDAAAGDLQQRRTARHTALERRLPLGPEVPDDSSPADAAVLHQLHRAAVGRAEGMSSADRLTALRRAVRDGDTVQERALTAVALEDGDHATLGAIAQARPDSHLAATLSELSHLRRTLTGVDMIDAVRRGQTFAHVGDAAVAEWRRSLHRGPLGRPDAPSRGEADPALSAKIAAMLDRPA